MASSIYRDGMSMDLVIHVMDKDLTRQDAGEIYRRVQDEIVKFLADEFVKQHGQEVLAKVDMTAVTNALAIKVSEVIAANLVKEKKDEQF